MIFFGIFAIVVSIVFCYISSIYRKDYPLYSGISDKYTAHKKIRFRHPFLYAKDKEGERYFPGLLYEYKLIYGEGLSCFNIFDKDVVVINQLVNNQDDYNFKAVIYTKEIYSHPNVPILGKPYVEETRDIIRWCVGEFDNVFSYDDDIAKELSPVYSEIYRLVNQLCRTVYLENFPNFCKKFNDAIKDNRKANKFLILLYFNNPYSIMHFDIQPKSKISGVVKMVIPKNKNK